MYHIIKKQVFDFTITADQNAFDMQQRISNYSQQKIVSVLQKVFDEITPGPENLYIDRLTIDLGKISFKMLNSNSWAAEFEMELRTQLKKISDNPENKNSFLWQPKISAVFWQWMFSMQNGYLPWNSSKIGDAWYAQVLEAIATDHRIAEDLRSELKNNSLVVERIVLQHPISFLIAVIELLTAEKQDKLTNIAGEFLSVVEFLQKKVHKKINVGKRAIETAVWKKMLHETSVAANTIASSNRFNADKIIVRMVNIFFSKKQIETVQRSRTIHTKLPITLNAFKKSFEEKNEKSGSNEENKSTLFFVQEEHETFQPGEQTEKDNGSSDHIHQPGDSKATRKDSLKTEKKTQKKNVPDEKMDTSASKEFFEKTEKITDREEKTAEETKLMTPGKNILPIIETESNIQMPAAEANELHSDFISAIGNDEIFIKNAGVVLLHPFLGSFFKILEYVKDGWFITDNMHCKALYLVHFLATGETKAHEHDLTIAKILCAYPLEKPVDGIVELNEKELQEAENMIAATIANWQILKNTSITGLREGFLQRPGKVFVKNRELNLHVEASSIDVLLDHLLWNLSIVKLPWMQNILQVQWR